ncbi:MAG: cytochrome c3 family protein, partial [Nitrospiraceae bacterium]
VCHGPGGTAIEAAAHQPPLADNCTDCHNPMRDQTPNIKHVKTGLASFTGNTVWTNFVDGAGNGVCETCHTATTYYNNTGSGLPHETAVCTTCHEHVNGFAAQGTCISCHTNVPGGATYVRRAVVSSDFTQASRHVFGGNGTTDVTQWDCAVCHMEADESLAVLGGVDADTRDANLHNNSGGIVVDLRNVDDASNDAAGWTWNKFDGTCDNGSYNNITDCIDNGANWTWNSEQMLTDMDNFCMSCHDGDGASDIAVNSAGTAIVLGDGPCTAGGGELACTPFNDALRTANTKGGTGIIDDNTDGIPDSYERTEVLDVWTQFDPNNPSHHAVRGTAYSGHNNNWGDGAWVDRELKNTTMLITDNIYESAQLHCADCHTVDYNAHGGANGFMLQASSIDDTCYLCHNSNVYSNSSSGLTRWSHDNDSAVWGDSKWAKIGEYNGNLGSACMNCHGGNPATDGFGGIHGLPSGADPRSGEERYRFMGGSYMSHQPGSWTTTGGTATCYFAGSKTQDWSNCTQHSGTETGRTAPAQYDRGLPGSY